MLRLTDLPRQLGGADRWLSKDYCCEDRSDVLEWTQIKVTVPLEHLDSLVAIMSMISNQLQIEDYSDIDLKSCYGDLIDESILNADKTIASVSVYIAGDRPCNDELAFLKDRLAVAPCRSSRRAFLR